MDLFKKGYNNNDKKEKMSPLLKKCQKNIFSQKKIKKNRCRLFGL